MNKIVLDQPMVVGEWLAKQLNMETPFHNFYAIGVESDGELIAGVAFDGFAKEARCQMHCAGIGKRWCSRKLLELCFTYAFVIGKVKVVVNTVSSNNHDSLKFTKHVGFEELATIKDGDGDADLVILTLHRDKCKWIDYEKLTRKAA